MQKKKYKVGVIGASGYGGNELIRLLVNHPEFQLVHVAGETSAGMTLSQILPWIAKKDDLVISICDANITGLDLVFISLPSGASKPLIENIDNSTKIVDLGEDHRFVEGWQYGLADIWSEKIRGSSRIANPGCYPTAILTALAPVLDIMSGCDSPTILLSAISGVSGAGRAGGKTMGFADVNEDVSAYKLEGHSHTREMGEAIGLLSKAKRSRSLVFVPHLAPMTRGIVATCFLPGNALDAAAYLEHARDFYKDQPFVRVSNNPVHSKWATGSNLVFITYAKQGSDMLIAVAAIDNLGKGAAGQAVQNANLMLGLDATAGLEEAPLIP